MLNQRVEDYLQTGSGRLLYTVASNNISGCMTIAPRSGTCINPTMNLQEAKFSFIIISGGTPIVLIDNDHSITISGVDFFGLHNHTFCSGSTINRTPISGINTISDAGSYAQTIWNKIF